MVTSNLDKISPNFLWGSSREHREFRAVNWASVTKPSTQGGLGIRATRDANIVAMAKLNWRVRTEGDSTWASVLKSKCNLSSMIGVHIQLLMLAWLC